MRTMTSASFLRPPSGIYTLHATLKGYESRISYAVFVKASSRQPTVSLQVSCNRASILAFRLSIRVTQMPLQLEQAHELKPSKHARKQPEHSRVSMFIR